ncbi:hypothetical protein B0E37_02331 [Streptomyces sp. MH192]|nr:hypothetical protein [Streptomyces sp. MH192]MCF0099435.1 hypothetical protein [Streptomyces sp. MH191]
MKRKRHTSAPPGPADAVHVVSAQRHATALLLAAGRPPRHAAPPVGNPYVHVLPHDLGS